MSLTKPAARCKMQELVLRLQGHDLYNLSPGLYALPPACLPRRLPQLLPLLF